MRSKLFIAALLGLAALSPAVVLADGATEPAKAERTVGVTVGSSSYVRMGKAISRVAVGDAQIAQVTAFDPDQLLISGLRPGRTTATVWVGGEAKVIAIDVAWPIDD